MAAIVLQAVFPQQTQGAERHIAWSVVLLVCGVVTYVTALQRYGTIDAVGAGIAGIGTPLAVAFLLCTVAAVTSAVASSAGILGAMIPLAAPFMAQAASAPAVSPLPWRCRQRWWMPRRFPPSARWSWPMPVRRSGNTSTAACSAGAPSWSSRAGGDLAAVRAAGVVIPEQFSALLCPS